MERFAALDCSQVTRNGRFIVSPLHTGNYHYDCSLCMQDEPPLLLLVLLLQSCCLVSSKDLSIDMRYDASASRIHHTVYFLV